MKTKNIEQIPKIQRRLLSALAGFALICSGLGAQAQDLIVNSFDNDGGGTFGLDWANFRDYAYSVDYSFDATQDSTGNPSSGSMYVTVNWPLQSDFSWNEGWNDIQFAWGTPTFCCSNYINFDVDIKVDVTNSSLSADGWSYGAVELIINNQWVTLVGWVNLAPTAEWQHFSGSFSGITNALNSEAIIGFISDGTSSPTGPVSVWIDNIVFTAPPTVFTNQPTLSLAKAPPAGLTCICSKPLGTWQRQMVQTVNSNYSWNTATAVSPTTTYSMNIAACPGVNYPGFESQMFLIPGAGMVAGPSVDWYSANVVDFFVGENPDGTGAGTLQYKVNNPSSGNMALAVSIPCASGPVGNWILTFNNNTNVTITTPDNTSTNFTIPASDASLFQDPLSVYVGTLPNNNANVGQSSTFSRVQVSGSAGSINDTFASLNPATWVLYAEDPPGVFITAPDAKYWVTWPFPDYGFTNLYASDNLAKQLGSSQWSSLPTAATGWISVGGAERLTVINQSTLNTAFGHAPTNCFFGLFHP
ncbi:MAG: hypothetical protein ABSF10_14960 [Verrucomicrobiota bacterium]|jgi:hypothetical protein